MRDLHTLGKFIKPALAFFDYKDLFCLIQNSTYCLRQTKCIDIITKIS